MHFQAIGLKLTSQRRLIADVISGASDYPDFDELYRRVAASDPHVSRATVYRTLKVLISQGLIECHSFLDGRHRYEWIRGEHHHHLVDLDTGKIAEFADPQIEQLLEQIAQQLGYRLIAHRFELYVTSLPHETHRQVRAQCYQRPHYALV
jgi:Fur family ferric uptake transcriptional regulator